MFQNRSRPCLLHQIKRCSAPCVEHIGVTEYAADVRLAELFLRGGPGEVIEQITQRMQAASDGLEFERAAGYRDQLRSLQKVLQRQYVSTDRDEDADIIAVVAENAALCVNLAMVRGGRHLGDRPQLPRNAQDWPAAEALGAFIEQHYIEHPAPARVLVNLEITTELQESVDALEQRRFELARPRNEAERAWIAMAERNAQLAILARAEELSRTENRIGALQGVLDLPEAPARVECFDVSHTMGEATRGVVRGFRRGPNAKRRVSALQCH